MDKFIEGNVYVFSSKKFLKFLKHQKIKPENSWEYWFKEINGVKVEILNEYSSRIKDYTIDRDWCKCIENNN